MGRNFLFFVFNVSIIWAFLLASDSAFAQNKCVEALNFSPANHDTSSHLAEHSADPFQTAERLAAAKAMPFRIAEGRQLFVQFIAPANEQMPVLLMMPGVNFGINFGDPEVVALAAQGFGIAGFNFSVQPLSIGTLPAKEKPAFQQKKINLQDLADDTEALAAGLRQSGIKNPIVPVSLSYSGAVTPLLKNFPVVIDTAPMTSWAATNPDMAQYYQTLKSAEFFNPFFGPAITRSAMDQAYRPNSEKQADRVIGLFKLPANRKEEYIDGYMAMSRASEGQSWELNGITNQTRRVFILAGKDKASLLKHQLETFQQLIAKQKNAMLFLFLETGHIIPDEQPEIYAQIMKLALTEQSNQPRIFVVEPSTKKTTEVLPGKIKEYLAQLIGRF